MNGYKNRTYKLVPKAGLEPAQQFTPLPPQGSVSTNSTTSANLVTQSYHRNVHFWLILNEQLPQSAHVFIYTAPLFVNCSSNLSSKLNVLLTSLLRLSSNDLKSIPLSSLLRGRCWHRYWFYRCRSLGCCR